MILALKILLAHFIGDFWLQPESWVKDKKEKRIKSVKLYWHISVHAIILSLLLFDFKYYLGILVIVITHLIIDVWKVQFQTQKTSRLFFWIDQFLHLLVILMVVDYYEQILPGEIDLLNNQRFLLLVLAFLLLTVVSSTCIKVLISKWSPDTEDSDEDSLAQAGSFIGKLERLFVFGFIALGQFQAVGFLLAAKSVFRFGDLKEAKDRKLTEYILIGTLLSFGFAILIGVVYNYLIQKIH